MINEIEVFNKLNDDYDLFASKYGENQILCVFAYGAINYGMYKSIEDLQTEVIYLPTFQEICLNEPLRDTIENGVIIRDFRLAYQNVKNHSTYVTESLYTDYKVINPKYEELVETYFLNNRDIVSKLCWNRRLRICAAQGLEYFYAGDYNTAIRILKFCEKYEKHMPYDDCLVSAVHDVPIPDVRIRLVRMKARHPQEEDNEDVFADRFLQIGIKEIIKYSFIINDTYDIFIKELNDAEKVGLKAILEKIKEEGNISLAKVCAESDISRQVLNEVIRKLKESGLAIVQNQGCLGTYVKILNEKLKNF